MSAKIKHIIDVINEVRDNFRVENGTPSISQLRIKASKTVATLCKIDGRSVTDTYRDQIQPDIKTTAEFDSLLEKWLLSDSTELRDILLKHYSDADDEVLINNAFYKAPEDDMLLAEEFGIDPNDVEFREGKKKLRIHLVKERKKLLVALAKKQWLKENNGSVLCSICCFSFDATYGDFGTGYIEAHHTIPISTLTSDTIVRIGDLSPVCSNCHSIIHRYRPWLTIKQLKDKIAK